MLMRTALLLLLLSLGGFAVADVNVHDYGAVGDGIADDAPAIQSALNEAEKLGPVCQLPAGFYRLGSPLTIPPGVTFRGASGAVPHSEHPTGSVLLAFWGKGDENAAPQITLRPNATIREMIIHYPEQTLPDVVPYPWTIQIDGELCQVTDMTLTNPYKAIDCGSKWNELHTIRNVFGCPLRLGIYIDQCSDIGRIENVHFNPNFWTRMALTPPFPGGDIKAYLEKNLVGFAIGRTDWEFISNCFVIFPRIGYHFADFGHGPGNAVITQSGSDICPVAVQVDATQGHSGAQFVNGQFMGTIAVAESNAGPIKLSNCGFWPIAETREQIRKSGPSTMVLTGCHFAGWDSAGAGDPCIRANGGRLIVNGCEFMSGKEAIALEPGLTAATVFGNLFRSDESVSDTSGADVQMGLNATH
jgi:hypothetical protein